MLACRIPHRHSPPMSVAIGFLRSFWRGVVRVVALLVDVGLRISMGFLDCPRGRREAANF